MSKMPFGSRIAVIRKALKLTQKELSNVTKYEQGHISRIESNQTIPSFEFVEHLLDAHPEISLDYMIHGEGEVFKQSSISSQSEHQELKKLVDFLQDQLAHKDQLIIHQQKIIEHLTKHLSHQSIPKNIDENSTKSYF